MGWWPFGPPDIAALQAKRNVRALIAALRSKHQYTRWNAMRALRTCGDDRAIEPLISFFEVESKATETLTTLGAIASRSGNEEVIVATARRLLEHVGASFLGHGDPSARSHAMAGLRMIAAEKSLLLPNALLGADRLVRGGAAWALVEMGDARGLLVVEEQVAAGDFNSRTAFEIVGKLEQFGDAALPVLRKIVLSCSGDVASRGIRALCDLATDVQAELLAELRRAPRSDKARTLIEALEQCGWKPETVDDRILYAVAMGRSDWLLTYHAENPHAVAAAVAALEHPVMSWIESFGDATALPRLADAWRARSPHAFYAEGMGVQSVEEEIAAALEAVLKRAGAEASAEDLRAVTALKDRQVEWYPTRDGEPYLAAGKSVETVSLDTVREMARAELSRRGSL